ncbi:MAG TPA: Clp protease N-terminal domain-containing protein, partial [Solirubrobacteraceae bacterium]|nr:Clp protease N-terminal domain-containing protein [Solirubrobacteraceae bacterium]
MKPDRFTIKSREAIEAAGRLAETRQNPQTTPEHLLAVLLEQEGGVVAPILGKLGVAPAAVRQALTPALDALPTLSTAGGAPAGPSNELIQTLRDGEKQMRELGDEYLSTEHLALALAAHPGPAGDALRRAGVTRDGLRQAIEELPGRGRVTDDTPEDKFQALERFATDLTRAAEQGKLDPVIGRDDEIRRVVQVLS